MLRQTIGWLNQISDKKKLWPNDLAKCKYLPLTYVWITKVADANWIISLMVATVVVVMNVVIELTWLIAVVDSLLSTSELVILQRSVSDGELFFYSLSLSLFNYTNGYYYWWSLVVGIISTTSFVHPLTISSLHSLTIFHPVDHWM